MAGTTILMALGWSSEKGQGPGEAGSPQACRQGLKSAMVEEGGTRHGASSVGIIIDLHSLGCTKQGQDQSCNFRSADWLEAPSRKRQRVLPINQAPRFSFINCL